MALFTARIPYPVVPTGKRKGQLITLNNLSYIHWASLDKAKKQFKNHLREWFLHEWEKEPMRAVTVTFQAIRHNRRKLDADNTIIVYKWLSDLLTELRWVEDDCRNRIVLEPSEIDTELNETMLYVKIEEVK